MYLYYCNRRECTGHIKSWERCDDSLAFTGRQHRPVPGQAPKLAVDADGQAEGRVLGHVALEPGYGADITWV